MSRRRSDYDGVSVEDPDLKKPTNPDKPRRPRKGIASNPSRCQNATYYLALVTALVLFLLLIGVSSYVGWGSRQASNEPLYAEISHSTSHHVHWDHKVNAGMILCCGIGALFIFALLNFLIPNKGAKDGTGVQDPGFFNHFQVYVIGGTLAVYWFLTFLVLGINDIASLLFGPLLAFASESHFGLASYIIHLVDKRRTRDLAVSRVAWKDFCTRYRALFGTDPQNMSDKAITSELEAAHSALALDLEAAQAIYEVDGSFESEAAANRADAALADVDLIYDCWPLIKTNFPKELRTVSKEEGKFTSWKAGDGNAKVLITSAISMIATNLRFALWAIVIMATVYTWVDLNESQKAAAVMMMMFDFFFFLRHVSALIYSFWYEPVTYSTSHGTTLVLVNLVTIAMSVNLCMSLYKEGEVGL